METVWEQKDKLRNRLRRVRRGISKERRASASKNIHGSILKQDHSLILSFASFGEEIDLWPLNHELAVQNRLLLPRMEGENLCIYYINNISNLTPNSLGILEPNPSCCQRVDLEKISLALVPGLAFDSQNHRLGYGGGFYDRFLKKLSTPTIGVGFTEQLSPETLPSTPQDLTLNSLLLS